MSASGVTGAGEVKSVNTQEYSCETLRIMPPSDECLPFTRQASQLRLLNKNQNIILGEIHHENIFDWKESCFFFKKSLLTFSSREPVGNWELSE